ncbi:MAG: bifunctional aspartate kinase/diaminopimelate decarboxylase [Deltaproteobacteria bacterium]|nr:MAG: bifunctional aspartate kinase/diaminopimelate decarboxylase [Deltaproteobacteria bacterium]
MSSPRVVLKFGGTSVSRLERWRTILSQARRCLEEGERPLLVCSALAGVSNLLVEAVARAPKGEHEPALAKILEIHERFAQSMDLDLREVAEPYLTDLERLLLGASLLGEVSPRQHARILSAGELLSTRLGAAWLRAQGLQVDWLDARDVLTSLPEPGRPERSRFLQASVSDDHDPSLASRLASMAPVVVTQGFIARSPQGATVLLGRGGSDTSAALFAARLGAARCEIWTDVPGMFSANPRQVPEARLLARLGYEEAQEIASTGAKVLHPRCLPPVRRHRIPLQIRCTERPDLPGTLITSEVSDGGPRVSAISARGGITLIRMDTVGMWQQVGFLADVFACFRHHGLSVDLVSTSESNVTVTLDPSDTAVDPGVLHALLADLGQHCQARAVEGCASVSLVGRRIRGLIHRLGPALQAFEEQRIHLISQAASDLNLTFVIDAAEAERLVVTLHALLFDDAPDPALGPSWRTLFEAQQPQGQTSPRRWWSERAPALCELARFGPRYVLHGPTFESAARALTSLQSVDRVLFAMKANPHPEVLRRLTALGVGLECVSPGEIERAFHACPDLSPDRVLFTPNFAPREEYEAAFAQGVLVTLDNVEPLQLWPEVFAGRAIQIRVDPGHARGHHEHVRTAGSRSKFGIAAEQIPEIAALAKAHGVRITGLHAHAGSGIRTVGHWAEIAAVLIAVASDLPDVRTLDLGGGLGVPERPGDTPLDLAALDASLAEVRRAHPQYEIWLEPGRYLVAGAGVLVAPVTQTKQKGEVHYVGIGTGMNSLLRPALYGAWHDVVNLSRLGEPPARKVTLVGPICETGDTLGRDRSLPETRVGDVLLIDVTGAYGRAMSSHYNLRAPAEEIVIED